MEYIEIKYSLDSKLQTFSICSVRILDILEVIASFPKIAKSSTLHQAEFVAYYNENNDEITKTAFLRHFSEKWHMSEHPLLRRLEEWIGKDYTFSTEYCTQKNDTRNAR